MLAICKVLERGGVIARFLWGIPVSGKPFCVCVCVCVQFDTM